MLGSPRVWQAILFIHLLSTYGSSYGEPLPLQAQQQLGDRLLMQVNFKVFTQRQLEIYLGIREVLLDKDVLFTGLTNDTWSRALEDFRDDMIIAAEASKRERIESTAAQASDIRVASNVVEKYRVQSLEFRTFINRLAISSEEIKQSIEEGLQVVNFRSKKKVDAAWLREALIRNPVRFFEDSKTYIPIFPLGRSPQTKDTHVIP